MQGQNIATIGFGESKNDYDRSKSSNNKKIQNDILGIILQYEGKSLDKILISSDEYLNLIDVIIEKQETVIALKRSKYIRYFEPADYRYLETSVVNEKSDSGSSSGCGYESEALNSADFTTITPNASFNDGVSSGRSIQKCGTYVDSIWPWSTGTDGPNDQCGHGTSMSSAAAAPRNDNGMPVGVAYDANLVTYRAAANVVLEGYHEQNGVKNAFTALGNRSDVKIISMSMAHIFSVGKTKDGIKYAYSKGKLIFCAGGTSTSFTNFSGVIFPAWMAETIAVTGVKEGSTYQKCDVCHTGDKIEFTVVMQRAVSGNTVPVNNYNDNQTDYVGGSSLATATSAGITALVWAKHPTWTRGSGVD